MAVTHKKVSAVPDEANTSLVRPSDWNDDHVLVGANVGALVCQGDAAGVLAAISSVAAGQALLSNGVGVVPSFQALPTGVLVTHPSKITADWTIAAGYNGLSAGPIEVGEDVTVTVADHATWSIV